MPLLEPFSLSEVPFLSEDFSVRDEKEERKGRLFKYLFSLHVQSNKTHTINANVQFCALFIKTACSLKHKPISCLCKIR